MYKPPDVNTLIIWIAFKLISDKNRRNTNPFGITGYNLKDYILTSFQKAFKMKPNIKRRTKYPCDCGNIEITAPVITNFIFYMYSHKLKYKYLLLMSFSTMKYILKILSKYL